MLVERNLKRDLFALALLAGVIFLGVALCTYHPADPPSTLVYPGGQQVRNACGRVGAWLADRLLNGLGMGAFYLLVSLVVLDGLLLLRRKIDQPFIRTGGWILSLLGLTTVLALILPQKSPGPVVGAGGFLGAAGRTTLEMHFALAGASILALSMMLAGLLMCTDYLIPRALGRAAILTAACGGWVAGIVRNGPGSDGQRARDDEQDLDEEQDDEDEEYDEEDEYEEDEYDEDDYDEDEEHAVPDSNPSVRIRARAAAAQQREPLPDEAEPTGDAGSVPPPTKDRKLGVKGRIASALRISKPKQAEREEVMQELDAASCTDEAIDYELPSAELLLEAEHVAYDAHEKEVRRKAKILEKTFANFGHNVKVVEIETGPVIAQYEVQLEAGLRLSRITGLSEDLAIALRVPCVRIVAPIPGKNTVGIEVPNESRQLVRLREVIEESTGRASRMKIPLFLGKDVSGSPMVVDLATLPHLLIAGRTGTGKSVCLNSMIASMIMTRRPDEVRMLMIDPKMVELSPYKSLPHLMHPVVTDMRKAEAILAWAVEKMEERYSFLARAGVRHVSVFNQLGEEELRERMQPESDEEWEKIPRQLPFIVIVADEMADLMMTAGKEVEQHIIRLAQKSRAVGIHLILATQKPTVDVITGLIKSNLPARIAFQVASRTDSRVVLDETGADKLLGNGDMLFLLPGTSTVIRGQGTFLSDDEITDLIKAVGTSEPQFVKELVQLKFTDDKQETAAPFSSRDELYEGAVDVVVREGRGSVSLLQRTLGIGYGRAARLIDYMAEDGIVGSYNGSQAREVLVSVQQWEAMSAGRDETGGGIEAPRPGLVAPVAPPSSRRHKTIRPHGSASTEPWDQDEGPEADGQAAPGALEIESRDPDESFDNEQAQDQHDDIDDKDAPYQDDEYEEGEDEDDEYEEVDEGEYEEVEDDEYEDDEVEDDEDGEYEDDEDGEYEDDEDGEYEEVDEDEYEDDEVEDDEPHEDGEGENEEVDEGDDEELDQDEDVADTGGGRRRSDDHRGRPRPLASRPGVESRRRAGRRRAV